MRKSSKARLFSTCLTGAILAAASPAWGQGSDAPTWKPRAEVDAQVGKDIGVSTSLFAPIAQNDSSLVYVDGRIGYEAADGAWKFMLWGKNIFDKYYWTTVIPSNDSQARFAGMPATYGITLGFALK